MSKKNKLLDSSAKIEHDDQQENAFCLIQPLKSLRVGMVCPRCKAAKIEYNGMLNLVCPNCGLTEAGVST